MSRSAVMNRVLPMYWLLRRELWEHKALWLAPAITGLVVMAGLIWGYISLVSNPDFVTVFNREAIPQMQSQGMDNIAHGLTRASAGLLYMVMLVVLYFYSLDCLYGERKDRSILFWRSLPVSDTMTVGSKLLVALLLAPIIVVVVGVGLEILHLILAAPILVLGTDLSFGDYAQPLSVLSALLGSLRDMWLVGIWFLPYFGWLFLVSAWARRAAFLWAVLPPLGLALLEWVALRSAEFLSLLGRHLSMPFQRLEEQDFGIRIHDQGGAAHIEGSSVETTGLAGLTEPGFWIGLAIGITFLATAVAIRRYRGETD